MRPTHSLLSLLVVIGVLQPATAQSTYKVSTKYDAAMAQGAAAVPGLHGRFRQQILVSASRLAGIKGKDLKELWFRRDLYRREAFQGGKIDLEVRISPSLARPDKAHSAFASNASPRPTTVFKGRLTVPTSPALGTTANPWSATNSVRIAFSKAFRYAGGDLCIDLVGSPVAGVEPSFWFVSYEEGKHTGKSRAFGKSCSAFADTKGNSHHASDAWLQIGSTMRLVSLGRPGSTPLLLLGAAEIPGGVDLSPMGAHNCRQHIAYFLITPLRYSTIVKKGRPASLHFELQIPSDRSLLGRSVFTQFADDESALAVAQRTNPAGLTTSNGLELQLSSVGPNLGMATVTSKVVDAKSPIPGAGRVDVNSAPVLRVMY